MMPGRARLGGGAEHIHFLVSIRPEAQSQFLWNSLFLSYYLIMYIFIRIFNVSFKKKIAKWEFSVEL